MIAVRMRAISKRYLSSGICANDAAELEVAQGSIHAIVGENGAGKTTLMKILAGLEVPDSGSVEVDRIPVMIESPAQAQKLGIGMVHQHFLMFDELNAAQNIFFGIEPVKKGWALQQLGVVDSLSLRRATRQLASAYGFDFDPSAPVGKMSISGRQQIEILRQLARDVRILILDEPTSALTEQETRALFEKLAEIRRAGHTILLVTHKLDEIMRIADRVTVMRLGRTIGTYDIASISESELSCLIMGTSSCVEARKVHARRVSGPSGFRVEHLYTKPRGQGGLGLVDISFEVRRGEILGICALGSNGLAQLEDALSGFFIPSGGTCSVGEHRFDLKKMRGYLSLLRNGTLSYLPSDRMRRGIALPMSVRDNFIAPARRDYFIHGFFRSVLARSATERAIADFDIAARPEQRTEELSGGNIQKLSIARTFSRPQPEIMILCEPTWGLDIKATESVHEKILTARNDGAAVLLLSSDIDEVLALSDRISVLSRGHQVLQRENSPELNRAVIGEYLLGTRSER